MSTLKPAITWGLWGFVLVSLIYILFGRGVDSAAPTPSSATAVTGRDEIVVYFFHPTSRCEPCETMELLTRNALISGFSRELENGAIRMESLDYEDSRHFPLVQKYEVVLTAVVVVRMKNGKETAFENLDESCWKHYRSPDAFSRIVRESIANMTAGAR
ncbi:MAG TPA: hypothetical protein DEB39_09170 [Planctomycetaceae bacterium]|nr:hypothetical protein [Planctomycetaceae bacterium]